MQLSKHCDGVIEQELHLKLRKVSLERTEFVSHAKLC